MTGHEEVFQSGPFVFDRAPLLVYWEATRACDLSCVHCRAEAVHRRHPLELSTPEAQALFQQIAAFDDCQPPHLVITGGDPLQRPDLFDLIGYGRSRGLGVSVTPAGTPRLTRATIRKFRELGVASLALSLDGSTAERHDAFRGEAGSFGWTLEAAHMVRSENIPLQINTMVTAQTLDDIRAIYEIVWKLDVARWALFFLIPIGRGRKLREITAIESERLLNWLTDLAADPKVPVSIKTTEAHHFRRIYHQRQRTRGLSDDDIVRTSIGRGYGVRDGNGVAFVSHLGQVYPSGFLPLTAGNVRKTSLVEAYRGSQLFRTLRDVRRLKGKCGRCPFRPICGGSRARAYATTGDPLESDPLCPYQPVENGLTKRRRINRIDALWASATGHLKWGRR